MGLEIMYKGLYGTNNDRADLDLFDPMPLKEAAEIFDTIPPNGGGEMGWKRGSTFGIEGISFQATSACFDRRGCLNVVVVSGSKLFHFVRGSKPPYPEGLAIQVNSPNEPVNGTPTVFMSPGGALQIICPLESGQDAHWWAEPEDFPDPSNK